MCEQDQGVTPSGSGCQPSASAPSGSSQSGIPNADQRLALARLIDPVWMNPHEGPHVLDNYPGQADRYRRAAYDAADRIIASGIVAATAGETACGLDERSEQSPVAKPDAQGQEQ